MTAQVKGKVLALSLSALLMGGAVTTAHAATQATTDPSVLVLNQKLEGNQLHVEYAYLPQKGYAVVYGTDKDGNPIREPLGMIELNAGDHREFKIKLDKAPPSGSKLWVSLYTDKDGKAGFDRSGDLAIWKDAMPSDNQLTIQ